MLIPILFLILCLSMTVLAIQDIRSREVSVWLIVLVFLASVSLLLESFGIGLTSLHVLKSTLILSAVFGLLWMYSRLRFGKSKIFFTEVFGLGDILYFLAVGGLFTPEGLIFYLVLSSLSAIAITLVLSALKKSSLNNIPFVTYSVLIFLILLVLPQLSSENFSYFSEYVFYLNKIQ